SAVGSSFRKSEDGYGRRQVRAAWGPPGRFRTSQPDLMPQSAVSVLRAHFVLPEPASEQTLGQLRAQPPLAPTTSRRFPACIAGIAVPTRLIESLRVPARPSFSVRSVMPSMLPVLSV